MSSFLVAVGLPCCLALLAALDVCGELSAYETGALDGHEWVTRVLIRWCLDLVLFGQGWCGMGWGGSILPYRVRNRVYLLGTHPGSFVLVGLQEVVPKWFRRWFRFCRWF